MTRFPATANSRLQKTKFADAKCLSDSRQKSKKWPAAHRGPPVPMVRTEASIEGPRRDMLAGPTAISQRRWRRGFLRGNTSRALMGRPSVVYDRGPPSQGPAGVRRALSTLDNAVPRIEFPWEAIAEPGAARLGWPHGAQQRAAGKGVSRCVRGLLSGCDSGTYTLYRNSVLDTAMRIHVATFDEASGDSYNGENCRIASELFAKQSGVTVRYWCEKGRYRK